MQKQGRAILWRFMLAGFLVPCLLFLVLSVGHIMVGGRFTWLVVIPWPTFVLMMGAEAGGGVGGEIFAFLISAFANVVVYGLVGLVVSFVYRRFFLRTE
jgi:hypothetical protein